jgi:hypothetical protein
MIPVITKSQGNKGAGSSMVGPQKPRAAVRA